MNRASFTLALVFVAAVSWAPLALLFAHVEPRHVLECIDARGLQLLGRSALLAGSSALVALLLGLPLAWILIRTDVPGARALRLLCATPLLVPPLLYAIAWTGLIDLRGPLAAVLVLGLGAFPLVAAAAGASILRVDARAIEAALLAGGPRATLRLELRLAFPAALAAAFLVFALCAGDFAVCDYVSSVGPKLNVYADEIFLRWSQARASSAGGASAEALDASSSRAIASALPLVALGALGLWAALRCSRRAGLWSRADTPRLAAPLRLGRWRWPTGIAVAALVAAVSLVPLSRMLFEASGGARPVPGAVQGPAASSAPAPGLASSAPAVARAAPRTLAERGTELRRSFGAAFTRARADLRRSVGYGTLAALVGLAPAFVIAHAIARHRERAWARALEFAALLPLALPGCVVGIAAILLWNSDWLSSLYATSVPAVAVLTGRFLPLCVLVLGVAFARQDPALEEAAAMAGASPLHRMVRIVAPMAAGACVLAALAVYACAVRELDIAVLVPALNSTAIVRLYNGVHFARDGYVAALALLLAASIVLPFGVWALARGPRRLEQA